MRVVVALGKSSRRHLAGDFDFRRHANNRRPFENSGQAGAANKK
jgi:hypothetical protein